MKKTSEEYYQMLLDFFGLKVGDKVKKIEDCIDVIYKVFKRDDGIVLKDTNTLEEYSISLLFNEEYEIIPRKKTVGDMTCQNMLEKNGGCQGCPLLCLDCYVTTGGRTISRTLNDILNNVIQKFPILEPIRESLQAELDKEIE